MSATKKKDIYTRTIKRSEIIAKTLLVLGLALLVVAIVNATGVIR